MIDAHIKNTLFFKEIADDNLSDEEIYSLPNSQWNDEQKKWFSYTQKKFIAHIDTFYYSVFPDMHQLPMTEWQVESMSTGVKAFLEQIREYKDTCSLTKKSVEVFSDLFQGVYMQPFGCFDNMYRYKIGIKDKFDIFITDYLPNADTPPIFVQIRSASLWLDGVTNAFDYSCDIIEKMLGKYGIKIARLLENRVDYAYHTNYIRDIANYFPQKHIGHMQVSCFRGGSTHFYIRDDEETFTDYFTLGSRRSNNLFFRVYDKTKEVIEMGYKTFFFLIWKEVGLINEFDFYILSECARWGNSWDNIDRVRAIFYLQYGKDVELKTKIAQLLSNPNTPLNQITSIIKGVVPLVTTVCNVEFQVKRKFFSRLKIEKKDCRSEREYLELGSCFKTLFERNKNKYREYIYTFFAQTKALNNFLTYNTLRFVKYKKKYLTVPRKKRPLADWWERLRSCKFLEFPSIRYEYKRFQSDIDRENITKGLVSKMAIYSAYWTYDKEQPFSASDVASDILNHLNDNDVFNITLAQKYTEKSAEKRSELRKRYNLDEPCHLDDGEQLIFEDWELPY